MRYEVIMRCVYKLRESETIEAMQLHGKGGKRTRIFLWLIGIALLLLGIFTHYKIVSFFAIISGVVGYFMTQLVVIPVKSKKLFRSYKALQYEITMLVDDQGISFSSESGESRLKVTVHSPGG